jgi:hypothetical protein
MDEREKQQGANQGKICEFCFATMTPRVRVPPGPPSNILIPRHLNEHWSSELPHGAQPCGPDSTVDSNPPENSALAIATSVRAEHL